jgi:hypothetical protein
MFWPFAAAVAAVLLVGGAVGAFNEDPWAVTLGLFLAALAAAILEVIPWLRDFASYLFGGSYRH